MNINFNFTQERINYFIYALFFYSLSILYIIPYELQLPHAKIFLPLLAVTLIVQAFCYRTKILVADIIIVCSILILSVINFSQYHLFRYSLPICLMAIGFSGFKKVSVNRTYLITMCWLTLLSMISQMIRYRREEFDGSGRVSLSVGDPNLSGLFMLLFFFLSYKLKFKPGIILGLASSVLFLSRNYFVTLVIFFTIVIFEKPIAKIASKINFPILFIILNIFGILVGEIFLQYIEVGFGYDTGSTRLFSFNDKSNLIRFFANRFLIDSYINNWQLALTGYGAEYENVFRPIGAIIHNSFLEVIAYTGIPLGILYFWVILRTFNGYYTKDNFKYIFSYLFFCLFLHTGLQGLSPFLFISVLALPSQESANQHSLQVGRNLEGFYK
ncbi:MAG: hypothetical protein AAF208_12965 [Cyanobacteria bacterium P01_A01_bin.45]